SATDTSASITAQHFVPQHTVSPRYVVGARLRLIGLKRVAMAAQAADGDFALAELVLERAQFSGVGQERRRVTLLLCRIGATANLLERVRAGAQFDRLEAEPCELVQSLFERKVVK